VTSVGMAKQTLPANAMSIPVEPRVDKNGPNCLDCIPLPPQAIRNHPVSPPPQNVLPKKPSHGKMQQAIISGLASAGAGL